MSIRRLALSAAVLAIWAWLLAVPSFADSQARIVRLSDVEGSVQIDRGTGQGFEKAFLNMPITQDNKVRTGDDGRAEVEFEDGSAVRITPNTVLDFPQLSLHDSGARISTVKLQQGTAYVNFNGKNNDQFTVDFGREKLALTHPAHLRVEMGDAEARVAMFKGDATIDGPSSTVDVSKKHTATFDLAQNDKYTLAKDLEPDPYDSWDKQQSQYQSRYNNTNYSAYSPYAYGTSDLSYYGQFSNVPGYGYVWQPYFTGSGWDPYMNGSWMWYPGYGYNWVSAYPWGWTPYHYGSWIFAPAYGWLWQPGGSWAGWNGTPRIVNPPPNFQLPHPPAGGSSTVVVNRGPASGPAGSAANKVVVRSGSAGLGIPRGSIGNLGKVQREVSDRGTITTRIHTVPVAQPGIAGAGISTRTVGATGIRTTAPRISAPPAPRVSAPPAPHVSAPHSAPAAHGSVPHR